MTDSEKHKVDEEIGPNNEAVPLAFGLIWVALCSPLFFLHSLSHLPRTLWAFAAAFLAGFVCIRVIWSDLRERLVERHVATHVVLMVFAPYVAAIVGAIYERRFDGPAFYDSIRNPKPPEGLELWMSVFWDAVPHALSRAAFLVFMVWFGGVLVVNFVLRTYHARRFGHWAGLAVGACAVAAYANHQLLTDIREYNGVHHAHDQKLLFEAEACLLSGGVQLVEKESCTDGPHGRDCDSEWVEERCSVDVARRYIRQIHAGRLVAAAHADLDVIEVGNALSAFEHDCWMQEFGKVEFAAPLDAATCRAFGDALMHNDGGVSATVTLDWIGCVAACSPPPQGEPLVNCVRACFAKRRPTVPEAAYSYKPQQLPSLASPPK